MYRILEISSSDCRKASPRSLYCSELMAVWGLVLEVGDIIDG